MSDDVARKLHDTTDARVWADEFLQVVHARANGPDVPVDRELMVSWFANAIETGRTHGGKMTLDRADSIAAAAFARDVTGMGATIAGLFLADVMNFAKKDVDVLANVLSLFVGTRGYMPTGDVDATVFKHAARAALKEIESEPFVKLERPQPG